MISITLGIFGILSLYQFLKLLEKLFTILNILKKQRNSGSLLEELKNLSNKEFYQWCINYMILKGNFMVEDKKDFFIINNNEFAEAVFVVKENLDLTYIFKCEALVNIENLNNIIIITLDDLSELRYLNNNEYMKIKFIDSSEFNKDYVQYLKWKEANV